MFCIDANYSDGERERRQRVHVKGKKKKKKRKVKGGTGGKEEARRCVRLSPVCFGFLPVGLKFGGATTKAFAMKCWFRIRNDWNVKK